MVSSDISTDVALERSRQMAICTENWVVLGDSLTEGVGFSRHSFVSELVRLIRGEQKPESTRVSLVRLRALGPAGASAFVKFGYAADIDDDPGPGRRRIWIWNLASEGTTIDTDHDRLPLIGALRPSVAIVFRGALDSIVRPSAVVTGKWPFWVPRSWQGYAATDPRCYFTTTWWRRVKQQGIDAMKQNLRMRLLQKEIGLPLLAPGAVAAHASRLFESLRAVAPRVIVCGLLPVSERRFPGSESQFRDVSERLRHVASRHRCEFLDWGAELRRRAPGGDVIAWFYRDGFHPNQSGCEVLAEILHERLFG